MMSDQIVPNEKELIMAVAQSTKVLFDHPDHLYAISGCFEILGNAVRCDRIFLFSFEEAIDKKLSMHLEAEWAADIDSKRSDLSSPQAVEFDQSWIEESPLMMGKPFLLRLSEINNKQIRDYLVHSKTQIIAVFPLSVRGKAWGFIGFDSFDPMFDWSPLFFQMIESFASSFERAVERGLIQHEMLEARRIAEEASEMKSQFLSNMSHEIRTPMNAILGYTALLEEILTDQKQIGYLKSIQKAGNSLVGIITDILDLSKIESGKMDLQLEYTDIRKLLDEVREIFALRIEEKKIGLDLEVSPEIPQWLKLDEVRMRQVLFNLIGNAVKFTEHGGIALQLTGKSIAEDPSLLDIELQVSDTGIGIAADQQELIFEPFKQSGGQSAKRYGGTGLGLAITKRLIEMMGGTIRVQSEPGKGSTFRIRISNISVRYDNTSAKKVVLAPRMKMSETKPPDMKVPQAQPPDMKVPQAPENSQIQLQQAEQPLPQEHPDEPVQNPEPQSEPEQNDGPMILIVDDIEENIEITRQILKSHHYRILAADSGAKALEILEASKVDLVLMDVMMPDMDGFETCTRIQNNPKTKDLPVIFLTAKVDTESVVRGFSCGAVDYIRKPFNSLEFLALVKTRIDLKMIREVLEEIATVDAVTKLLNQKEILRRIEYERNRFDRRRIPYALIYLEIERFKTISSLHPPKVIEQMLLVLADIIHVQMRKLDIPARWGQGSFLILLPESNISDAEIAAERLKSAIEGYTFDHQHSRTDILSRLTVSIELAEYSEFSKPDTLLHRIQQ